MKYFTINELTHSDTAVKLKLDNTPSKDVIYNLTKLVDTILDPLRELYGKPIRISSGYRSEKVNKAVGGSSTSQHRCLERSAAADICVINKDGSVNTTETRKLYDIIVNNKLPFDQIILEKGTKTNPQWIHVSYDESRSRRQKLYYNGKSYIAI